ncbi:MAG: ribosome maturation factor RimP [Persephonella sp.]|nr:MAG: ribosome maturation factor RimP [Persephonella sp.]
MDVVEEVRKLILPILDELDLKLVDIEFTKENRPILRVYIYDPKGTTIKQCEIVSRRLGELLDNKDLIPYSYILEISSPGLNRKLKNKEEYEIFKGRNIKIVLKEPMDKKNVFTGVLEGLEDDKVLIKDNDKLIKIDLDNISKARLND